MNNEKPLVDSKWLPCHVFLILILPEESVVFAQHIIICFVFGSDRRSSMSGFNEWNNTQVLVLQTQLERIVWDCVLTWHVWSQPCFLHNIGCSQRQTSYAAQTGGICLRAVSLWLQNHLKLSASLKKQKKTSLIEGYSIKRYQVGSSVPGFLSKNNKHNITCVYIHIFQHTSQDKQLIYVT